MLASTEYMEHCGKELERFKAMPDRAVATRRGKLRPEATEDDCRTVAWWEREKAYRNHTGYDCGLMPTSVAEACKRIYERE